MSPGEILRGDFGFQYEKKHQLKKSGFDATQKRNKEYYIISRGYGDFMEKKMAMV